MVIIAQYFIDIVKDNKKVINVIAKLLNLISLMI